MSMIHCVNVSKKEFVESRAFFVGGTFEFRAVLNAEHPRIAASVFDRCRTGWVDNVDFWHLEYTGGDPAQGSLFDLALGNFIEWISILSDSCYFNQEDCDPELYELISRACIFQPQASFEEFMYGNPIPVYGCDGMKVIRWRVHSH